MDSVYVIGEPGVGKSTLLRHLTAGLDLSIDRTPVPHVAYYRGVDHVASQIGGPHPTFPGTDRLSMGVQPAAIDWVRTRPAPLLLGEGDRLATVGFLSALAEASDRMAVLWLAAEPEVAAARRDARGSAQSEAWLAGRLTKTRRLAARFVPVLHVVDASLQVTAMVEQAVDRAPFLDSLRFDLPPG